MPRVSVVGDVNVLSVSISSILHIGDARSLEPEAKVLAVQRSKSLFFGDEGDFEDFPIFEEPLPQVDRTDRVTMKVRNKKGTIRVDRMKVWAIAASSIVQIGSNRTVETEARVKHIRQITTTRS